MVDWRFRMSRDSEECAPGMFRHGFAHRQHRDGEDGIGDSTEQELVNALRSEQIWPSNVENCPQS